MIRVNDDISLDEGEIRMDFVRASGPGGQNVNKVATAVQLRFDAVHSPSLPDEVRERLIRLSKKQVNREGILIIEARRYRTQEQNRKDALERLVALIRKAADRPRQRIGTGPTIQSNIKRLEKKRRRGELKRRRQTIHVDKEE